MAVLVESFQPTFSVHNQERMEIPARVTIQEALFDVGAYLILGIFRTLGNFAWKMGRPTGLWVDFPLKVPP